MPGPASLTVGPATTPALPAGRYNLTLTVTDGQGGSTPSTAIPVVINTAPTIQAASTPSVVNETDTNTISLSSAGTTDPDGGTIDSYAWTVTGPSGFTYSGATANVGPITLGAFGDYTVTLTVVDNDGGIATKVFTVRRNKLPVAGATITFTGGTCTLPGTGLCVLNAPYNLRVNGSTSTDEKSITRYDWRIFKAADLLANPNAAPVQTRLNGNIIEDFTLVDGGPYLVRLTVTDSDGASSTGLPSTASRDVLANRAPSASIGGPATLTVGRNADFSYQAVGTDPDGDAIASYKWVFKDENGVAIGTPDTVTDATLVKAINRLVPGPGGTGTGTVELTVTDTNGGVATASKPWKLVNQAPIASLSPEGTPSSPYVGAPGLDLTFTSASSDPDGTLISEQLSICPNPDGSPGCRVEPLPTGGTTVNFPNYGTYTVTLTVTDDSGISSSNTASDVTTVKINRPPTAGVKNVNPANPTLTLPRNVAFTLDGSSPTYSKDLDGTITSYLWVFSDGVTSVDTPITPSRTFTTAGTYFVDLTVFDNDGGDNTLRVTIVVTP